MPPRFNKSTINDLVGWTLFPGSLIFYFFWKLPFNLSVLCGSSNEGYYFTYGKYFLDGHGLLPYRPVLFLLYAFVLQILGFSGSAIVAIHFIQTVIVIMIAIFSYYITKAILSSNFYASLAAFLFFLMLLTPVGQWPPELEIESSVLAMEAEYLSVLFSVSSICFFLRSIKKQNNLNAFLAGVFSILSTCSKLNGAVICVAYLCWFIYIYLSDRCLFKKINLSIIYFFIGSTIAFLLFNIGITFLATDKNILSFWHESVFAGTYSSSFLKSLKNIFSIIVKFMFRYTNSYSNFFLFLFSFIFFAWGMVRNLVIKNISEEQKLFIPLLCIWGIGNTCAVIAPGDYGSYYYILVWLPVSFSIVFGLNDLFIIFQRHKNILKVVSIILLLFFLSERIFLYSPVYANLINLYFQTNAFTQPQSFQDPVLPYDQEKSKRPLYLKLADSVNLMLPNKSDTVYFFHFSRSLTFFNPSIYIYVKRVPPTTIFCDLLHYKKFIGSYTKKLIADMEETPPNIIFFPKVIFLRKSTSLSENDFTVLFNWLNSFLSKNYKLMTNFSFFNPSYQGNEEYYVYSRL